MTLLAKIDYGSPENSKAFEDTTLKKEGRNKLFPERKELVLLLVWLREERRRCDHGRGVQRDAISGVWPKKEKIFFKKSFFYIKRKLESIVRE